MKFLRLLLCMFGFHKWKTELPWRLLDDDEMIARGYQRIWRCKRCTCCGHSCEEWA